MEISVSVTSVEISPENVYKMSLKFNTYDYGEELLNQFTAQKVVNTLSKSELLDEIGEDYVREYFGIENPE